jgi:hypothetical protein
MMRPMLRKSLRNWLPAWAAALALTLVAGLLAGCASRRLSDTVLGPGYQPSNVLLPKGPLPDSIRRVAVLPLACDASVGDLAAGREALEPVLREELGKSRRFELVFVAAEDLKQRTGQASWKAEEKLPVDFLVKLKDAYNCDAILFSQLTVFRGYPPMAVGWRMRLVEMDRGETWWAADEVFDAGQPAVVNGARRYQQEQQQDASPQLDSRGILNSPRRFGHYTAATLLGTLPGR